MSDAARSASSLKQQVFQSFSQAGSWAGPQSGVSQATPVQEQPVSAASNLSEDQLLDLADQALTEAETGVLAQAVTQQATQPQVQATPPVTTSKKETLNISTSEAMPMDVPGGVQAVEQEPTPEIPPEVESFLEQKQENIDKLAQEIVVADQQPLSAQTNFPSKPVVVLPITEAERKAGLKKSPQFSFRWLVEWSLKIIKKFSGEVIYRQV